MTEKEASGIGDSFKIYLEMMMKRAMMKMQDSGRTSLKFSLEMMSQRLKHRQLKMIWVNAWKTSN
jgi:hypothetical protein